MVAPVIPAITDHEMEAILTAAADAGASSAGYVLLRLPNEIKQLFREWLAEHHPDRAKHVMSLMQQSRGGKDYDSRFGHRLRGTGPYADLLHTRFELATRKLGLAASENRHRLETGLFRPPPRVSGAAGGASGAASRGASADASADTQLSLGL
jgi:DNA repair photolyase